MEVHEIRISEQKVFEDGLAFPLVLSPTHLEGATAQDAARYVEANKATLDEKLVKHGAILFRDFPLENENDLLNFMNAFQYQYGSYLGGGGPRINILGPIHTSTETPPHLTIPFHHELAYLSTYPSKLFFYCDTPTEKDGETPILLSNRLCKRIIERRPKEVQEYNEKKLRYWRVIEDRSKCTNKYQRSWQESFDTEDRQVAEERSKLVGSDTVEWNEDGSMKVVSIPFDLIKEEARTKQLTWFNSLVLLYAGNDPIKQKTFGSLFGDFSPIENQEDFIKDIKEAMEEEAVKFRWHKNDVLLIDNLLAMHARSPFIPPRRILAAIIG